MHELYLLTRGTHSGGVRPHDKYVDRLSDIRHIQDFIVEEAQKEAVPVIAMGNIDAAIGAVLELVLDRAERLQEVPA